MELRLMTLELKIAITVILAIIFAGIGFLYHLYCVIVNVAEEELDLYFDINDSYWRNLTAFTYKHKEVT
jgi:hypothetical protein